MRQREKGHTLIELVVVVVVLGSLGVVGSSAITQASHDLAMTATTDELRGLFQKARITAITHRRNIAIRFRPEGKDWSWTMYEDGDGDGVRNDDITKGIDFPLEPTRLLRYPPAGIAVPTVPIPDPAIPSQPLYVRLPVRFGTSFLCSFTRTGESSNGSVVVSDGVRATVIDVEGTTAVVSVKRWNGKKWLSGV